MNPRRKFLSQLAAGAAGSVSFLAARSIAADAAPGKMEETDPVGQALGFKRDTTKVDEKKYPQHKSDQKCAACALYTGKPDSTEGPCTAFANKIVPAQGWCMAYAKKP